MGSRTKVRVGLGLQEKFGVRGKKFGEKCASRFCDITIDDCYCG